MHTIDLKLIKQRGFDFSWDERKVWELDVPTSTIPVSELEWHFDVPFWNENAGIYNLAPRDVMEHPEFHAIEWERIQKADTSHPLDVMENKGRWLLLDGLHRLVKLFLEGKKEVAVRIVPRERIPDIMNYEETVDECKRTLTEEGFAHVYEWTDVPHALYDEHTHKGKVSFFVVKGGIDMVVGGEPHPLGTGDRIDIPVGVAHTGIVGPEGCTFIVGEEIEGDS